MAKQRHDTQQQLTMPTPDKPVAPNRVNVSSSKEKRNHRWVRAQVENRSSDDARAAAVHTPQDDTPVPPPGNITSISILAATLGIAHLYNVPEIEAESAGVIEGDYSFIESLDPSTLVDDPDADD